jgi:hypothetical protein
MALIMYSLFFTPQAGYMLLKCFCIVSLTMLELDCDVRVGFFCAMWFRKSISPFQRNMLSPSSGQVTKGGK